MSINEGEWAWVEVNATRQWGQAPSTNNQRWGTSKGQMHVIKCEGQTRVSKHEQGQVSANKGGGAMAAAAAQQWWWPQQLGHSSNSTRVWGGAHKQEGQHRRVWAIDWCKQEQVYPNKDRPAAMGSKDREQQQCCSYSGGPLLLFISFFHSNGSHLTVSPYYFLNTAM